MVSRRWFSVLVAVPVVGLLGYELAATGQYAPQVAPQYPPQYTPQYPPQQQPPQQQPPQQPQQQPAMDQQAQNELRIELKKAQIQSALAERIAQVKEDVRRRLRERAAAAGGGVDEGQVLEADADAAESRAGAEVSKLNTQIVDLQLRNGQAGAPQAPLGYGQANPTTVQIMQLELKKAQIQTAVSRQIAGIRQRQFERLQQAPNGQVPAEALTNATLEFESARAMAEVAQLDEQLIGSRLQATGAR